MAQFLADPLHAGVGDLLVQCMGHHPRHLWVQHAFGHLDILYPKETLTPAAMLEIAIAGETYEYTQMYPGFAKTAREEGFDEIADWFESLAHAEEIHAGRFAEGLVALSQQ